MKRLNLVLAGMALVLGGCSLGPHMRMTVPESDAEGSAEYNGIPSKKVTLAPLVMQRPIPQSRTSVILPN